MRLLGGSAGGRVVLDGKANFRTEDAVPWLQTLVDSGQLMSYGRHAANLAGAARIGDSQTTMSFTLSRTRLPGWWQFTFPQPININKLIMSSAFNGAYTLSPPAFEIYGSYTGAFTGEQVLLGSWTGLVWTKSEEKILGFKNGDKFLTYRLAFPQNGTKTLNVAEVKLVEAQHTAPGHGDLNPSMVSEIPTLTSNTAPDGGVVSSMLLPVMTAAAQGETAEAYLATHSTIKNVGYSWALQGITDVSWQYTFPTAVAINKILLSMRGNATRTFDVFGSNGGAETPLYSGVLNDLVTYEPRSVTFANLQPYLTYRLAIGNTTEINSVALSGLKLIKTQGT